MGNSNNKIEIKNRKAKFNYEFDKSDEEIAGISLVGSEIKSIRQGKANIGESYCYIDEGEMFITGMHIAEFKQAGKYSNHDPYRKRKLLLTKKQIRRFEKELKLQGRTIVPLKLFINKKGLAKLKIALSTGKKKHDKRESIKKKDMERDAGRAFKG